MNRRMLICMAVVVMLAASRAATADFITHIVVGENENGDTPLRLFTDGPPKLFATSSGHTGISPPGTIFPLRKISVTSNSGVNGTKAPQFGGYAYGTKGSSDLGLDYPSFATGHELSTAKLPGPWVVNVKRIAFSHPAEFSLHGTAGLPELLENGDEYDFGDQTGGHVHPFWLARRPGLVRWDIQFTSNAWIESDVYSHYFTTVPGRGELVPTDMSSAFNADVVDSDEADSPTSFDGAGHYWVLNGLYGTDAGLPLDGLLYGFQLGGPNGGGLQASNNNVLLDDGTHSCAATIDLTATGQDDAYLNIEFLVAGAGTFSASDVINVTLEYADATTQTIEIKRSTYTFYAPYRPIDDWQQTATPLPQLAVGPNGDRSIGFARSNGGGIDASAGQSSYFFRATCTTDHTKVLNEIRIADYTGGNRVGVFAILAIKKAPLAILSETLADAEEEEPYSLFVQAEGTPPYRNWAATGLPSGLSIDADTGEISGAPDAGAAAGSPYIVEVSVEDSINAFDSSFAPESDTKMFMLVVGAGDALGDTDCSGVVDLDDVDDFVQALLDPTAYEAAHDGDPLPACDILRADINEDSRINGQDIASFIDLLM